ncbi:hypothetical protein AB6896_01890 [Rahnella inusitata]|uniref:hypothetical protein n=1 Tax=Rahnella inusitata TaxID=58169 RepID=UPI0039BDB2B1
MNNDLEQQANSFTASELEGMAHGNNPVANAYRELLAFRRAAGQGDPIGEIRLSEYRSDGTREASVVCLHDQADWDNFTDGTLLYLSPQPAHAEHGIPSEIPKLPHNGVMAYKKDGSIYSTNYARGWNDCVQAMLAAAPKPESE